MKLPSDRNKIQITRMLSTAASVFKQTADSWATIQQVTGLPEALYGVGKTLPILTEFLKSLEPSLKINEEEKEAKEKKIAAAVQFAKLSEQQAQYFDAILDAIKAESQIPKAKRYRIAAVKRGGEPVEAILKEMLQQAIDLATMLSVDEKLKSSLQAAYDEVAELKPSLEEDDGAPVSINNWGDGVQLYHAGEGHQNHCTGGSQYNGNGYTFHTASPPKG
ncbi:hypothetical protein M431DRAFT_494942 [Trichoderma harzianum CBS 226.95]|uniref:NACHT-NTPase and P-loop NTPases N-terminal domain-containing protein n=1 Tax=Trichoderma harzianum CBS 226.95 TaxID=983964 RepID=A0A2T4ACG5_TRIHA|nr:hypothetical protein M431DRAFT_494942 [Trichoderma harzianum CBS 226.95]PTB54722.1 hypothetical protein M431DRAFT_494942 [Trichoderma harzianum CBS 226.95]